MRRAPAGKRPNRTLIERRGHIVRGGTDNLDSSRISLVATRPGRSTPSSNATIENLHEQLPGTSLLRSQIFRDL
jgi:hypothetical protein